ncbi:dihydrolipoyl dehydrogenase family protein [Olsenella massiliensis]|uniref:dihydrolipoyl dehydrogenase family protein n=1 Tax=Olsenella massiliensis TaxID=1622075 RepID=UPI00071DA608|nr:FAD-dependent oxidoreductase [Olsenella massiliensis]
MGRERVDVIVIGGGPGGYTAALDLARRGKSVLLLERDELGGTCLNRGCVPTKALIDAAQAFAAARGGTDGSVICEGVRFDARRAHERAAEVVGTLRAGVARLLADNGVQVLDHSPARIVAADDDGGTVASGGELLRARDVVVATGCVPQTLPVPGATLPGVLSSDDVLAGAAASASSIAIVGGGVIGVEMAHAFSLTGRSVTVVEALDRVLPTFDREISQRVAAQLKRQGVIVHVKARVSAMAGAPGSMELSFTDRSGSEQLCRAAVILVATGRRPATGEIFVPSVAPRLERGWLACDGDGRTSLPHLWALGDVRAGTPQLAHVAQAQGRNVAAAICGQPPVVDEGTVPACVYLSPEVASVGLDVATARARGLDVVSSKRPTGGNARCAITGGGPGYVRLCVERSSRRLVGAQLVCPRATDLVAELALAVRLGLSVDELARTIHPHPTLSEMVMGAATDLCAVRPARAGD